MGSISLISTNGVYNWDDEKRKYYSTSSKTNS